MLKYTMSPPVRVGVPAEEQRKMLLARAKPAEAGKKAEAAA
jgi:hypothetical protein